MAAITAGHAGSHGAADGRSAGWPIRLGQATGSRSGGSNMAGAKMSGKTAISDDDIVDRWHPDPMMTDAEFIHQRALATEKTAIDGRARKNVGKVLAKTNLRTLMGGFCRFRGTEAQERAAARYRSLSEAATIGGAKAVDLSVEPVDGRGANREPMEIGADARAALLAAQKMLGRHDLLRWEYVVIGDHFPTAYALRWFHRCNGRAVEDAKDEVRKIADRLAVHWKLQSRA